MEHLKQRFFGAWLRQRGFYPLQGGALRSCLPKDQRHQSTHALHEQYGNHHVWCSGVQVFSWLENLRENLARPGPQRPTAHTHLGNFNIPLGQSLKSQLGPQESHLQASAPNQDIIRTYGSKM